MLFARHGWKECWQQNHLSWTVKHALSWKRLKDRLLLVRVLLGTHNKMLYRSHFANHLVCNYAHATWLFLDFLMFLGCPLFQKVTLNSSLVDIVILGTLGCKDGKARTEMAVDAGNFRRSYCVAKNKMLKMFIFAKDGNVDNSNFVKAIHRSNDIL